MTKTTAQAVAGLCSISEAAGLLGASYQQAYNMAHKGTLGEVVRISGKVFINVAAVKLHAKHQRQEAIA